MGRGKGTVKEAGWLRRSLIALLSACLFFGGLETVLGLCGFGYHAGYLRSLEIAGAEFRIGNPDFFRGFFPPRLAPYPEPFAIPATKPPETYRIFILGESAALGIPESSFGFGRFLERILHFRHPGIRFEVVNLSVTAVNSHVLLPIARSVSREKPDLLILYMGNNEVIGPYGPGTVFAPFAGGYGLIKAAAALKTTRTGQLLDLAAYAIRPGSGQTPAPGKWAGLEMFLDRTVASGDPRMEGVYADFRRNLTGILASAKASGSGVIVGTMAANLRDNSPFASLNGRGISGADRKTWRSLCDSAEASVGSGNPEAALRAYVRAVGMDPSAAEAHFRMGRVLLSLGRSGEASRAFQRALDLDALRFRADSRINSILRETAAGRASEGVWLADADSAFRAEAVDGAPGAEFFYEHVHLRPEGNHLLAGIMAAYVDSALAASGRAVASAGPGPSFETCRASLALSGRNRLEMARKILAMGEKPPFAGKSDHAEHLGRLKREVDSLSAYLRNDSLEKELEEYAAAVAAHPGDLHLRRNLGGFFYACDYLPQAVEHFRAVAAGMPHDTRARQLLAKSLGEQGDLRAATREYAAALGFTPDAPELHNGMANTLSGLGEHAGAARHYESALKADDALPEVHFNLSRAYLALGRRTEAEAHLDAAVRLEPALAPAARELKLRGAEGKP